MLHARARLDRKVVVNQNRRCAAAVQRRETAVFADYQPVAGALHPGIKVKMRIVSSLSIAAALLAAFAAPLAAETLGDPQVGFTAERVLVLDGKSYIGRMWNNPGEQRHEQVLPSSKPVFILRSHSSIADVLLPQLHTAVEFDLPKVLSVLGQPDLIGTPIG